MVTADEVMQFVAGNRIVGGKMIDKAVAGTLKANAGSVRRSVTHKEIQKVMKLMAYDKQFHTGVDQLSVLGGRMLLFYIHEYDRILEELEKKNIPEMPTE